MGNKHITLSEFAIEVTRRCNMACEHCLRGEAEDMDLNLDFARKALEGIRSIDQIVFTGGEPSLNVPCMEALLGICRESGLRVNSFFLATNGKEVTMEFLECLMHWYAYCILCYGDDGMSAVALSRDMFHEDIPYKNRELLGMLSFYDEEMKDADFSRYSLIGEGRAGSPDMDVFTRRAPDVGKLNAQMDPDGNINVCSMLYLSCNGDIRTCCDAAYNNNIYTIGNIGVESLAEILLRQMAEGETA